MLKPATIAQLRPLLQTAFVAHDLDPLAERWCRTWTSRAGMTIVQESAAYCGEPFDYTDMGFAYLEIICPDAGMSGMFQMIRKVHCGWDGRDPLRPAPADEVNRGTS